MKTTLTVEDLNERTPTNFFKLYASVEAFAHEHGLNLDGDLQQLIRMVKGVPANEKPRVSHIKLYMSFRISEKLKSEREAR